MVCTHTIFFDRIFYVSSAVNHNQNGKIKNFVNGSSISQNNKKINTQNENLIIYFFCLSIEFYI